jgi:carbon-monoxide dehydrogenase medium subunit
MIPQSFEYSAPATLQEALQLLADPASKPLAGGMSLIPLMKLRLAAPGRLVDLGRVPGLRHIREESGAIHIGALATHYEIETSPLLRARCPLLAETAAAIGDLQVRNMGTIGGSIAHADPAADYPAALMALEAQLRVASAGGERTVAIEDFLLDAMTTALEPGEMVCEIVVPVEAESTGVSYQKMKHPASGFAIVGVAVRVRKPNGAVEMARVGITGLGPRAFRARQAEQLLLAGQIAAASQAADNGSEANADLYASADYRRHMARVYASRAIRQALERAS